MNYYKKSSLEKSIIGIFVTVSSALPFLTSFPKLIGEPFDARFQIVVHEHWFLFFKLERPLRDVFIFYPFDKTLGYSDIFFVNGIIYSIFRTFTFSILEAWTLTNFIIILIGNIGFAILLYIIFKNKFIYLLALVTLTNSYAFIAFLNIWPNTVGNALVSWVFLFIFNLWHSNSKSFIIWINLLLIALPLLTLTYWYPGFFSILGLIIFILLGFISRDKRMKEKLKLILQRNQFKKVFWFSPIWISLWVLFLYIIIPTRGNLRRAPDEIFKGSLSVSDFFSIDLAGPAITEIFLSRFINTEWLIASDIWAVGYPVFGFIVFILIAIVSARRILKFDNLFSFTFFIIIFSIFFTTRLDNLGIYIYLWQNFDILGVIRTPVRLNILINFLMLIFIFQYFDNLYKTTSSKTRFFPILLVLLISLEQLRILSGAWETQDFLNKELSKQVSNIPLDCEYLVLINEGAGHWSDTIEGMILSSKTNIPSINGYSGTSPQDTIRRSWDDPSEFNFVVDYINRNKLNSSGCVVTNKNIFKLTTINSLLVKFSDERVAWEFDESRGWAWIEDQQIQITITNPFEIFSISKRELLITKSPCLHDLSLDLMVGNNFETLTLSKESSSARLNLVDLNPGENLNIRIKSSEAGCSVGNDPRNLIYSIELVQ